MRFKVIRGIHSEGGVTYNKGDIVDSQSDLNRFNSPGSTKFQQINDESVNEQSVAVATKEPNTEEQGYTREELRLFKINDLRIIAEEFEVDLSTAKKKEEIISAILGE